jgi:TRAP-type mannitol/chloroaromatic compound transport system permease small subunit
MGSFLSTVDAMSEWTARAVSWLFLALTFIVVFEVVSRSLFDSPTVWVLPLSCQLYAAIFMLGGSYTLREGAHIRIGFFRDRISERRRAFLELLFYLLMFFPFVIVAMITGTDWAWDAWVHLDTEPPFESQWQEPIYPFKTILPVAFYLLCLQGLVEFVRNLFLFMGKGQK